MFDTIRTYLNKDQIGVNNLVQYCEPFLSDITTINSNYYQCTTGTLSSGHKVSISENGISFQGSLTKYYKGTNLVDLQPCEIKYAIEKLSDELHLPMELSKLTKLDIGINIETDYSAEIYFPSLGNKPRNERHKQANSIYYSNGSITHLIYNKIKEAKKARNKIPNDLQNKNITRVETRIKGPNKYFNTSSLTLDNLTKKDFQILSIESFLKEYFNIKKINFDNMATNKIKTPNDFINYCATQYLKQEGAENIDSLLKQLKQVNALKYPEAYSRLRKQLNKLTANNEAISDDIIGELNKKVIEKAQIYLSNN